MKGVQFWSLLLSTLVLIGVSIPILIIVVWANGLAETFGGATVNVTVEGLHLPIKYENIMMSYLETTSPRNGIPMKTIIRNAAYQGTTQPYVNGVRIVTLEQDSYDIMSMWVGDRYYLVTMTIDGGEERIAGSVGKMLSTSTKRLEIRRAPVKVIYPGGVTTLTLYVSD